MEAVGAAASFIAIGQALAAIPKLVTLIQQVANTREELEDLLFELEILAELRDQAEERLDLIQSEKIPDVIPLIEPPYITRLKNELEKLLTQLTKLAGDCETATKQKRLSSKIRVKWIWEKPKVNTLCERARRVREYLHAAIDMLEKRATLQLMKHQSKLLVEIHTVTTTRRDGTQDRHEIQSTSAGPFSTTRSKLTDLGQGRKPQRHACECQCHTLAARHSRNSSSLRSLWSPSSCRCNCRYEWQHRARYQMPTWLTGRIVQFTAYYSGAKFELAISLPEIAPYEQSLAISSKSKTVALEYLMKRRSFPTHETTLGIPLLSYALTCDQWDVVLYWLQNYDYMLPNTTTIEVTARLAFKFLKSGGLSDAETNICRRIIDISGLEESSPMIHTAIRNGYGLIEALECQPNAINDLDETGQTPLRLSCVYERFEDMMYLIENGADPNTKDFEGLSPLHVAASNSLEPYVHALVDAGSDLNSRDSYDCTPLFLCLGNEAPHIAVTKYLLENGASVHSLNKLGDSIFHRMSIYAKGRLNTEQIFSQLMGAGANSVIDVADCDGNVPVNIAIMYNNVCMIRLLLSAGARIDIPNNNGNNVLHQAAHLGTLDTLQTLRDAQIEGIDIRATNNYGFTPIKSFWHSVNVESPGSSFRVPSEEETKAFEELMRDIRDRGILNECASLEALVTRLRDGCASEAQESLEDLSGKKRRAKIYEEAETFRAIALDIRRGDIELAIESLEEFMTVSKERMKLSPFEEEPDPWASNSDDESTDEPIDDDHSDGSDYQSDKGVVSDDE